MRKTLLLLTVILLSLHSPVPAAEPALDLEALKKSWEESRNSYRDALEEKRALLETTLREKEKMLEEEQNAPTRKIILDDLRNLRTERDEMNDKIRAINAGDVVKLANGRDKIVSTLTGQTPI